MRPFKRFKNIFSIKNGTSNIYNSYKSAICSDSKEVTTPSICIPGDPKIGKHCMKCWCGQRCTRGVNIPWTIPVLMMEPILEWGVVHNPRVHCERRRQSGWEWKPQSKPVYILMDHNTFISTILVVFQIFSMDWVTGWGSQKKYVQSNHKLLTIVCLNVIISDILHPRVTDMC